MSKQFRSAPPGPTPLRQRAAPSVLRFFPLASSRGARHLTESCTSQAVERGLLCCCGVRPRRRPPAQKPKAEAAAFWTTPLIAGLSPVLPARPAIPEAILVPASFLHRTYPMMLAMERERAVRMSSSQSNEKRKREPTPRTNQTKAGAKRPTQKTPASRVEVARSSCDSYLHTVDPSCCTSDVHRRPTIRRPDTFFTVQKSKASSRMHTMKMFTKEEENQEPKR
mmetsp:Transcript_35384/g.60624  ORF Transcript_35384/g.60624 Transcript_35384/m.60624 type:complete len:224 (+) Transcript_35384:56-727(+)